MFLVYTGLSEILIFRIYIPYKRLSV